MICAVAFACVALAGCESLAKKFVRKPKEPAKPKDVLLEPQEYAPEGDRAVLYEQSYLYWKSWHDEFITALGGPSARRQADTVNEALKSLAEMRKLLDEQSRLKLEGYSARLEKIRDEAAKDIYHAKTSSFAAEAEKLRRLIMSDFSPGSVKEHLL